MEFGVNLGFALKRWPEPAAWTRIVRDELALDLVQFTFDLIDPWWPLAQRASLARETRTVAAAAGITIHSAQLGIAWYSFNGLLDTRPAARTIAREWWKRAVDTALELGTTRVGGPPGAMTAAALADPSAWERCYAELISDLVTIAEDARAAGATALLIEPTPVPREIPSSVAQALRMQADLKAQTALPVRFVLDVGHALFRPLYGASVSLADWLVPLRDDLGLLHLQNHDYQSDAHLGWPDQRAAYDVAQFGREIRECGISTDVPVVLELFFPFEASDEQVLAVTRDSVRHCQRQLTIG